MNYKIIFFHLLIFLGYKHIYEMKQIHVNSLELLEFMCEQIKGKIMKELYSDTVLTPVYKAICQGTIDFVIGVLKQNPEALWCFWYNANGLSSNIVISAIENRQEEIYNLAYGRDNKEALTFRPDKLRNNILHIVAKFRPRARLDSISGAALQMQRELQWFKVPSYISC